MQKTWKIIIVKNTVSVEIFTRDIFFILDECWKQQSHKSSIT